MTTLVFLLEERSAKALLEGLLPRLLPEEVHVEYQVFEGKQDLERNVARRIRGWQQPDTRFVVVRDQDSAPDCKVVKASLAATVAESGKTALVRIACRTLEAWVVGDLEALGVAFGVPDLASAQKKEKFPDPDALGSAFDEIKRLVPTYQKLQGARSVGPLLDPSRNVSKSFRALCSGVLGLVDSP